MLVTRLQTLPIYNKKFNFMILQANYAIKKNLKNIFFLEIDLNKFEEMKNHEYFKIRNMFVQKEAIFVLKVMIFYFKYLLKNLNSYKNSVFFMMKIFLKKIYILILSKIILLNLYNLNYNQLKVKLILI